MVSGTSTRTENPRDRERRVIWVLIEEIALQIYDGYDRRECDAVSELVGEGARQISSSIKRAASRLERRYRHVVLLIFAVCLLLLVVIKFRPEQAFIPTLAGALFSLVLTIPPSVALLLLFPRDLHQATTTGSNTAILAATYTAVLVVLSAAACSIVCIGIAVFHNPAPPASNAFIGMGLGFAFGCAGWLRAIGDLRKQARLLTQFAAEAIAAQRLIVQSLVRR